MVALTWPRIEACGQASALNWTRVQGLLMWALVDELARRGGSPGGGGVGLVGLLGQDRVDRGVAGALGLALEGELQLRGCRRAWRSWWPGSRPVGSAAAPLAAVTVAVIGLGSQLVGFKVNSGRSTVTWIVR